MSEGAVVSLVINIGLSVVILAMAMALLRGKGAWLIAGYNTMSPEEKLRWNEKALCRFMGRILLALGLLWLAFGILLALEQLWFGWVFGIGVTALVMYAAVYANTGKRFKR